VLNGEVIEGVYVQDGEFYFEDVGSGELAYGPEYAALFAVSGLACAILLGLLPFAVQAASLIAENNSVPVLVMHTMKYYVTNFMAEMEQYLTILAVHKGTLAPPSNLRSAKESGASATEQFRLQKVSMTRDMALTWRMKKFIAEIEKDSGMVNSGVGLMVLNLACHLVPLNAFVWQPIDGEFACVPAWLLFFTAAQALGLFYVLGMGIECNEAINGGLDGLLHNWQLKFNMIGWSGGFLQDLPGNADYDVFVPRDPPGEREVDIEQKQREGQENFGVRVQAEQHHRLFSIVKVLAHYQSEELTPFKVLGVTITRDVVTLIFGFFGASIVALCTRILDEAIQGQVVGAFMCHNPNPDAHAQFAEYALWADYNPETGAPQ